MNSLTASKLFPQTPVTRPHCIPTGFSVNGKAVRDLGTILLDSIAVIAALILVVAAHRRRAAVLRHEIKVFFAAYGLVSLCDIFTSGRILSPAVPIVRAFAALEIGFTVALFVSLASLAFLLILPGVDDGTPVSVFVLAISTLAFFVPAFYIALDTGFGFTSVFAPGLDMRNYALYVLYFLVPLLCTLFAVTVFSFIVLVKLQEKKPMGMYE